MATLEVPLEEEEQAQRQQAGGGVVGTGMGGSTPTDRTSGSWTNLQSYLDLNKPQAQQMAGQIGQDIGEQRQQYGQNVEQQSQQYQDYLGGLEKAEGDKRSWMEKVVGGYTPEASEIQQKVGEGWFTQPGEAESFMSKAPQLAEEQRKLQQRIDATKTEEGRLAELQRIQGQDATRGEGLLNQLLVGASPNAQAVFGNQQAAGTGGFMSPVQKQADIQQQALINLQQQSPGAMAGMAKGAMSKAQDASSQFTAARDAEVDSVIENLTSQFMPEPTWEDAVRAYGSPVVGKNYSSFDEARIQKIYDHMVAVAEERNNVISQNISANQSRYGQTDPDTVSRIQALEDIMSYLPEPATDAPPITQPETQPIDLIP